MSSSNPDGFYQGDFIDEGSFLVLTPGDLAELRGASASHDERVSTSSMGSVSKNSGDTSLTQGSVNAVNDNGSARNTAPNSLTSAPRSSAGNNVGDQVLDDPVSSYFQDSSNMSFKSVAVAGSSNETSATNEQTTKAYDPRDVSLATVFSSFSSVTSSEANSLEEALELVATLKQENEGLKEALAQRNDSMRETLKSLHTSVATVEHKHAEKLKQYEDCKKIISELRVENERLKLMLSSIDEAKRVSPVENDFEKLEGLETALNAKETEIITLQKLVAGSCNQVKHLESQIGVLVEQLKDKQAAVDSISREKNALEIHFEDERAKTINLTDELVDHKRELELLKYAQQGPDAEANKTRTTDLANRVTELEAALGQTRLHLTRQKECIEEKDKIIQSLQARVATLVAENEQKVFCEAQMKEFEANFNEERSDKNKLAEELSLIKIELEKKTTELEKLHQTHLVLASEHLNRKSQATSTAPSAPEENQTGNQNVRQEQVQTNPSATTTSSSPLTNFVSRIAASAVPRQSVGQQEDRQGIQPCPLCQRRFANVEALTLHASSCGVALPPGTNPFIFP